MDERAAGLIALLGAPPIVGELIASYLRVQLRNISVERFAACTDVRAEVSVRAFAFVGAPHAAEIAWIRLKFPWSPVVVASDCIDPGTATETQGLAHQGFVARATSLSALAEALRTVLAGRLRYSQLIAVGNGCAAAHLSRPCKAPSTRWGRSPQALANAPPRPKGERRHPPYLRSALAVVITEISGVEENTPPTIPADAATPPRTGSA